MEKIKILVSQHRKASFLALFVLIVSTGFSTTSAVNVARQRAAEETAKTESVNKQGTPDDGKDAEEEVEPSSSQKRPVDGYDSETKKLVETLDVNVFSANNGRDTLRLHGDCYVKTADGRGQDHPYAISTVEFSNNGSDSEVGRIVFKINTGIHIATFTLVISADNASTGEYIVASTSIFKLTDMPYERRDAVKEINVTGLDSEITRLLDDTSGMKKQLSDRYSIHFPVTTTATWIGTCNVDYNEDTISTAFTISDGNPNGATGNTGAFVSVTYNRSEKKYSFSM